VAGTRGNQAAEGILIKALCACGRSSAAMAIEAIDFPCPVVGTSALLAISTARYGQGASARARLAEIPISGKQPIALLLEDLKD
jgi:hypothetical protein